jgi:hypothetical protein
MGGGHGFSGHRFEFFVFSLTPEAGIPRIVRISERQNIGGERRRGSEEEAGTKTFPLS